MKKIFALLIVLLSITAHSNPGEKCGIVETTCTGGPETRIIDGMEVTRECWDLTTHYACIQPEIHDTCTDQVARGGTLVNTDCQQGATIDGAFMCITEQREYQFKKKDGSSSTVADCSGQQFCVDGKCFDTGGAPDPDFAKAATGMEAMREAGVYVDQGDFQLFKGKDERCSKSVLQNCCKGTSKPTNGLTNLAVAGGSAYMFDALGFGSGFGTLGFIPGGFVLGITIMVIQEMISCDRQEAMIAVKRDHRLCHYVGEYCSKKIRLGFIRVCLQHKETYCCFNSKLSRMINEAARVQIPGLGWGWPEGPSCNGLTISQFQAMDFSKIDFSEFYDDIKPKDPNPGAVTDQAKQKVQCYFQQTGC